MTDQPPTTPAGWYPDPSGAPGQRYWDGTAWTDQETPSTATQPQPSPVGPVRGAPPGRNGLGIAALILGIIGAVSGIIPLLFWLAGTLGLIGLILGLVGRARVKRGEATNGKTALWGIITSIIALILAVVGILIIADAFSDLDEDLSGTTTTEPEDPAPQPDEPEAGAPGIGDEAQDGAFTFVVTGVEDGPAMIGTADFGVEPQGKFVFVNLTVTNHGDSAGAFFGDNQYLTDTEGREASADTEAAIYLDEAQSLYEEINPGNSLSGIVVFDIPTDAVPASVELHDSAFSGGVTVALE